MAAKKFSIILSRINLWEIYQIVSSLRSAIADETIRVGATSISITISIGIATLANSTTDFSILLKHADQTLYAAKQAGRNC